MLLSTKEVAKRMGVTPMTVRRLIYSGQLKAYKVGRLIKISPEALAEFYEAFEEKRRE